MAGRLPRGVDRARLVVLLPGDVLALALFVLAGSLRHNAEPWVYPERFALVLAPFLVGWLVAAPLLGAYSRWERVSRRWAVGLALAAWPVAVAVAMALRATATFPGDAAPTFYLVAVAFGAVALAAWRAVAPRPS